MASYSGFCIRKKGLQKLRRNKDKQTFNQNKYVTRKIKHTKKTWSKIFCRQIWHKLLCLPFSFGSNLKTLYGLVPSRFPKCFISTISCIFRRAQRNLVFQVAGSGWSPGRYFPVWLAHRLNNSAWVSSSNSGLSTRTQGTLKIPISLSIHSKPSISPLSICCSSQGVNRCRCFATLRTKDRSFSKDETCNLDSIFLQILQPEFHSITSSRYYSLSNV